MWRLLTEPWPERCFMAQWSSSRLVIPIPVFAARKSDALKCAAVIVHLAAQSAVPRE